jgi:nucleotide-binding universal stress UspA family protein
MREIMKKIKISNILVGIDGSESSIRAFEFAKDLALKHNSQIIAFTAFNIPDLYKILENKEEDYNTISIEEEIRKIKKLLADLSRNPKDEGLKLKTKFYDTNLSPDLAITQYAESKAVDHIVIGSRGRSFENLFIGNVATSVVKMSKCSVTIIK